VSQVLEENPNHLQANFNLGVFYWRGREDYAGAASQFQKVLELAPEGDTATATVREQANASLAKIREEAEAAGQPLPSEGTF
jgi:cytochrome c-type biogenesis protein CcmH/NrfG